ncbi:MAG: TonB-dependent receptor, partial [Gammaproteobacteria bacterium]|nr:TonB-dependent receptor [Gammaproteobacteria bacterium]
SVLTWKAGLSYAINDQLRLRGTQSRDIRAGNLSELFTPVATVTAQMRDPRSSTSFPALSELRGNATLDPEKADTTTVGMVYQPNWLEGLRLSLDYYRISIDDSIGALSNQQILDLCFLDNVAEYCGFVELNAANLITKVIRTQLNLDQYKNRGIDIEAAYALELGGGTLSWRFLASHLLESETTASVAGTVIDTAGEYTTPDWSLVNTLSYRIGRFTATLQNNYYSGGAIDNRYILGEASNQGININDVSSTVYTNLSLLYDFSPARGVEAQVFLRVNNMFNVWPPYPSIGGGLFDSTGASFRLGVRVNYGN